MNCQNCFNDLLCNDCYYKPKRLLTVKELPIPASPASTTGFYLDKDSNPIAGTEITCDNYRLKKINKERLVLLEYFNDFEDEHYDRDTVLNLLNQTQFSINDVNEIVGLWSDVFTYLKFNRDSDLDDIYNKFLELKSKPIRIIHAKI